MAYRTPYKTHIGSTHFRLINGKACHMPVDVEHRVHSTIQLINEHEEWHFKAYESASIYKEKTKRWHVTI